MRNQVFLGEQLKWRLGLLIVIVAMISSMMPYLVLSVQFANASFFDLRSSIMLWNQITI